MSRKTIKGFTTLELLIILVIIGFFVAMLAPRLSQMFDDATTKISDMNKKDSMRFNRMWTVKHGPKQVGNDLINMVYYDVGGPTYRFMSLAEKNTPSDGAEWLSYQLVNRMKPYLHTLIQEEVDELRAMGMTHVYMGDTPDDEAQKRYEIVAGMQVLMVGAGNDGTDDFQCGGLNGSTWAEADYVNGAQDSGVNDGDVQPDPAGRDAVANGGIPHSTGPGDGIGYQTGIGNPDNLYRIMMGIGPDSTLVEDGVVDNEGISPDAMSQELHYRFNRYVVLLPRLRSTVRAITGRLAPNFNTQDAQCPKLVVAERTDENNKVERNQWLVADNLDRAAQPFDEFDVISPEGYELLNEAMENMKIRTDYDGSALWQLIPPGATGTIYNPANQRMFNP